MKFSHSGTEEKLCKQWVKQGATIPAAHPQERNFTPAELGNQKRVRILYILLGLSICILCAGLVLLIIT